MSTLLEATEYYILVTEKLHSDYGLCPGRHMTYAQQRNTLDTMGAGFNAGTPVHDCAFIIANTFGKRAQ